MRRAWRTTAAAAGALVATVALTAGVSSVPAQAETTTGTSGHVQPAAPGWHHIGNFQSGYACREEGRRYLENDWAIRYECRYNGPYSYALWVLTNI